MAFGAGRLSLSCQACGLVDTYIPNDKLLKVLGRGISLLDAFGAANDVLKARLRGITRLITRV